MQQPKNEYRDINDLKNWDDNPRSITKENFELLKKHIKKFGQYKPVIINEEGIVIGGNMRLRALRELGEKLVWVSVVHAPTRPKMLEYALSDNESFGDWEDEKLAEMLTEDWVEIDKPDEFNIEVGRINIKKLLEQFGPDESGDEEPKGKSRTIECPNCHFKFTK